MSRQFTVIHMKTYKYSRILMTQSLLDLCQIFEPSGSLIDRNIESLVMKFFQYFSFYDLLTVQNGRDYWTGHSLLIPIKNQPSRLVFLFHWSNFGEICNITCLHWQATSFWQNLYSLKRSWIFNKFKPLRNIYFSRELNLFFLKSEHYHY